VIWEAPAKINLTLEVRARDREGMHPLRSLVQAIEWCDLLDVDEGDEDRLRIDGADLPDGGDNLVWKAITALRSELGKSGPSLEISLRKSIPVAAGLGGGSSDAAAALLALAELRGAPRSVVKDVAPTIGADVPFFLVGGTAWMEGHGEQISEARIETDSWALAIATPDFELRTEDVYRVWDRLDEPLGPSIDGRSLPPALRQHGPFRNDLTPAAIASIPELGDWIEELAERWERPVAMSGSGPSLFAFFADLDEAEGAVRSLPVSVRSQHAALPRRNGVTRIS